jgi:iron complex outermembrane receptor protein
MTKVRYLAGAASVVIFVALSSNQASAQVATPAPDANAAADTTQLQEIVVTAQHRKENAQNIPVAISVVSGASLDKAGYQSVSDIQRIVPSVQFDPNNGGGFQVRGVGTQVYDNSTESAVGIVVDDVVMDLPRNPGISGLTAVSQIDVLRGPQGTLFGKNATAGVIVVNTQKPTFDKVAIDGGADFGERSDHRVFANLNAPLTDNVAVNVSGVVQGQHGAGRYVLLKTRMGDRQDAGVRGKLRFAPTADLDIVVSADYAHHHDNGPNLGTARGGVSPARIAQAAAIGIIIGPKNIDSGLNEEVYTNYSIGGGSIVGNYTLSGLTLTFISAYRSVTVQGQNPLDQLVTTPSFIVDNLNNTRAQKFSQEFRLASASDRPISYVAGLFYNNMTINSTQTQAGNFYSNLPAGTYLSNCNGLCNYHNHKVSAAAYGQLTAKITNQLGIDFGGRLTHETNQNSLFYSLPANLPYTVIPIGGTPSSPTSGVSITKFTYKISPTFKLNKDVTLYGTFATGYKGPGVAYLSGRVQVYKPETVKTWEAGVKSELFDHHLRLNMDVFLSKYKNFQAQDIRFVNGAPVFLIVNAGGLKTKGAEVEFTLRANSAWSLSGGVTYADSIYTNYLKNGTQFGGSQLTNAPKWVEQIAIDVNQPISNGSLLSFNASYIHRSSTYFLVGDTTSIQEGYGVVNMRAGFGPENKRWQVGAYARNLLNQSFSSGQNNVPPGLLRIDSPDAHRTLGGFVRFSF